MKSNGFTMTATVVLLLTVNQLLGFVPIAFNDLFDDATYPNQGRHIVRDPLNSRLHVCWQRGGEIYYSFSDNDGADWAAEERIDPNVGNTFYPAVAVDKYSRPWIVGVSPMTGYYLLYGYRRDANGWTRILEAGSGVVTGPPSLVVSNGTEQDEPMGYVVVPSWD